MSPRQKTDPHLWAGTEIAPGTRRKLRLDAGESFTGSAARLPLMVWRSKRSGPVVGITAAVHGDEINGTGAIRRLALDPPFRLSRGTLILAPVVNVQGFERHSRYCPDRRDLNRSFPGSAKGSLTSRLAHLVFQEVVARCDYLLDLHTAAVRRTNFPNVRTDMSDDECARLANVIGCELILDSAGPDGSLRREATRVGCPSVVIEAGEVFKIEPSIQEFLQRGIRNVLIELGMVDGEIEPAPHVLVATSTRWVRAGAGGFLRFHVSPGEPVQRDQPIATNTGLLGKELEVLTSPTNGVVIGMTTMPAVAPGDPVAHIATPETKRDLKKVVRSVESLDEASLEGQIREHLATNVTVIDPPETESD